MENTKMCFIEDGYFCIDGHSYEESTYMAESHNRIVKDHNDAIDAQVKIEEAKRILES